MVFDDKFFLPEKEIHTLCEEKTRLPSSLDFSLMCQPFRTSVLLLVLELLLMQLNAQLCDCRSAKRVGMFTNDEDSTASRAARMGNTTCRVFAAAVRHSLVALQDCLMLSTQHNNQPRGTSVPRSFYNLKSS